MTRDTISMPEKLFEQLPEPVANELLDRCDDICDTFIPAPGETQTGYGRCWVTFKFGAKGAGK